MEGKGKTGKQFSIVSGHMIFSAGTVKFPVPGYFAGLRLMSTGLAQFAGGVVAVRRIR